jgi:Flp pilus assembly protein TadG
MRRHIGRLADEGGQAIVEFALVLPLLLMVITAIVQFGIAYDHYLQLTDAVRDGARVAALSSKAANGDAACAAVQQSAPSLDLACGTDIAVTASPDWKSGSDVTVAATSTYPFSVFGLSVLHVPLTSSTTERIE